MKCLTMVIHKAAKQDLLDFLLDAKEDVTGFTLYEGEGHSTRTQGNPFETSRDLVMGYVPRIRVDIIIRAEALDRLLTRLRECDSCVVGRGVWWVTPVEGHGYL